MCIVLMADLPRAPLEFALLVDVGIDVLGQLPCLIKRPSNPPLVVARCRWHVGVGWLFAAVSPSPTLSRLPTVGLGIG